MKLSIENILGGVKANKYLKFIPDIKREKTQRISTIVLSLLALSFFSLFAINPTLSTIANLRKQLSDSKFVDEKLQGKIINLSSLSQKYNLLESDIPIVFAAIPKEPEAPTLMGQIQALAQNSNIKIENAQTFQVEAINKDRSSKEYISFHFTIQGQGSFKDTLDFLSSLGNMQRVISLDTISVGKKINQENLLQIGIKGTAYFKE
ncbi:MAG: hypothetical protein A2958_00945 [Candidatus Levybacteria bacterium RIFCSPLOWO2_01_FULL_38_13]|nr:MAG: hypothetical protein A2629_00840 [Candidatus Levybacteria bacterium RIFCSPHIGHO2_01_FULL_41_15]OGH34854.1 MAG: hypothetical protein A2958_00945 [Candidatus Levybacteria bacterium RIFCSPLOWO2_01_FULL_38_13]